MTVSIILNGLPRKKKKFYSSIHHHLVRHFHLDIRETRRSGHAEEIAASLLRENPAIILVAGGDGTLNQVINGLMLSDHEGPLPMLGLVPLGSGNDFARACGLTRGINHLIGLISVMNPRLTDIAELKCRDESGAEKKRYFMNVSSVGMGPEVVRRLERAKKKSSISPYLSSILTTFFTLRPQELHCKTDGLDWKGKARVIAVANGQSFGDSIFVAPDSSLDDGLLNTFIAGEIPLWKFLILLNSIKKRKKISDPLISYHTGSHIELSSPLPCPIETDGELAGFLPASISVASRQIPFLR